jgi:ubiquinone/menaquinone biosynthesis C-methylase UbiE
MFSQAQLFLLQTRERCFLKLLKKHRLTDLATRHILDVGCGSGGELLNLRRYGAQSANLYGVDLLSRRIDSAGQRQRDANLVQADGRFLPFRSESFDLALQFTVFTSILDRGIKKILADDLLRVLKPGGCLIWYDFWADNPRNPQVKGIRSTEIRQLFPACHFDFQRVTLAPPLARRIVPISWVAAELFNRIPSLLTHYLAVIRKES